MDIHGKIRRSDFLRLSAMAAVTATVAACGGGGQSASPTTGASSAPSSAPTAAPAQPTAVPTSAPQPTTPPQPSATSAAIAKATEVVSQTSQYKESPLLAQMVKDGKLPSVDKRLPDKPYVVPHAWLTTGKYGGWIQMATSAKDDKGTTQYIQESMYGHSLLRWLKDGLEIGPGLIESWSSNTDQSEWTLNFRKGLKWSDGQPWTTDDIMFWWEDEVQTPDLKEYPPDEAHSGKGTLMKLQKVDDNTLKMVFDAPAPLTVDRLAMWVKRGIGPRWMDPKHYLQQFHPKYNTSVDKSKWVDDFIQKREFRLNPDCPTMTGWMLKSYTKGQNSVWVRNPFYWVVDKDGNQLPYIDGITMTNIQDPQVYRLQVTQGKVDYVHGGFSPLNLSDVSTLQQAQAKTGLEIRFWDGGDGTGSAWFFNYDYYEPKMRALIRNPKFRQALSLAVNREQIQKSVYYGTGEMTTGTMSPKALEFHVKGGPEVYQSWRDSFIKYDLETAKKMLDEIGVKLVGGKRTMPDGSPLKITLDYHADQDPNGPHVRKDELIAKDWQAIGLDATLNPVTPTSWDDMWAAGKILNRADWGVGDGPNCLVYPQWMMPIEETRWAPLEGRYYEVLGTPKADQEQNVDPYQRQPPRMAPEKGGPIEKIWNLYNQTKLEPDVAKRTASVWEIVKIHATEGPFFSGTVANTPMVVLVRKGLMNVPKRDDLALHGFTGPWIIPSPAVYDPETYFWDNPDEHKQ